MGLISLAKETKNTGRGMSLLLVFFPDHHNDVSPSSSSLSPATTLFRARSSRRLLLSKAQSTISICILLLLLTLFLFTLSTFEPSSSAVSHRRFLLARDVDARNTRGGVIDNSRFALQGMGTLFLRGTKRMHDLIVAHIGSDATEEDLRLFVRLLHRSGVTSRSDVVLLFDSNRFDRLIGEENRSFLKLVDAYRNSNQTDSVWGWGFNPSRFIKNQSKNDTSEPIWGRRRLIELITTRPNPENSLSGFMDHVPMALRRWACYPMLLGRVRRSFKHVMLVDAKTSLFLADPFTRIRNRSPESVLFFSNKHKKTSEIVNPSVMIGGARGIRRLSSAMHTEIARAAMQKKRSSVLSESAVLSQLVGSVRMTTAKGFEAVGPSESIAEASSLAELRTRNSAASSVKDHDIVQRGNVMAAVIMKRVCSSSKLDSSVYSYC
ncbi:hypothetical protein Bca52824_077862 [Brassica carinata]|uniref:DUF7780 domain-containing protein n=1 Tax=Brassica carinata TaxID=52824 RepID=A0A8X7PWL2_BRACI|nr:hypothetical protein Bca52824_077862 [Brassica carinata]